MRAEDIVGVSFFLQVFIGIGLMIYGSARARGTPERARWLATGLAVMGFAFLAFGALTFYLIRTSARLQVEGNIWAVSDSLRSSSSRFNLTDSSGRVTTIRSRYSGPGLREGDRARVRYVEYNHTLIELTMLSGPYTGWRLQESAGEWGGGFFALVGLVCGMGACRIGLARSQTGS